MFVENVFSIQLELIESIAIRPGLRSESFQESWRSNTPVYEPTDKEPGHVLYPKNTTQINCDSTNDQN